jgi:tetratricopeptide (TPR) repeat protein
MYKKHQILLTLCALVFSGISLLCSHVEAQTDQEQIRKNRSVATSVDHLLKAGDICFQKQRLTTPKEKNAFDIYKDVLKADPENRHARKRIHEIAKTYKKWGDEAYKKKSYDRAEFFYQRYLLIARYVMNVLRDRNMEKNIRKMQQRLEQLKSFIQSVRNLLKEGDACFKQQQFLSPKDRNAFDIYKDILRISPKNAYAREKIKAIMNICLSRGNEAYEQKDYMTAKTFYQNYRIVADYLSHISESPSKKTAYQMIEKRLGRLDHLMVRNRLEPLKQQFSKKINQYGELKKKEEQGADVSGQIVPILRDIIKNLKEIEAFYEQISQGDAEMLEKIDRVRDTRGKLEKEISAREDNTH